MAAETLEQISRIVDSLEPLGDATPGEPVRAEEWNAVVTSVVDLARIALARERTVEESLAADYALAGHEHRGSVDLGWLDPVARDLVEGGRAQRADLVAELGRARRDLDALQVETARVAEAVAALERRVMTLDDRDFDRGQRLNRLGGAVDSIGEQEASISDLRRTFSSVDTRVGEALALRDELIDESGQRIDLASLRTDVTELRRLEEQLRTADGTVVEIRAFEQRLAQVEQRVDGGTGGGTGPDLDVFRGEVLDAAEARTRALLDPITADIDVLGGRVDTVSADVGTVATRVTQQEAGLAAVRASTTSLPALATQVATLQSRVNDQQVRIDGLAVLPQRLDGIESRLDVVDPLANRVIALEKGVASMATTVQRVPQLEERLGTLEKVRGDLADLSTRVDATASTAQRALTLVQDQGPRLDRVEAGVDDQSRRLATVETQTRSNSDTIKRLERAPSGPIGRDPIGGGTIGGGPIIVRPGDVRRPT